MPVYKQARSKFDVLYIERIYGSVEKLGIVMEICISLKQIAGRPWMLLVKGESIPLQAKDGTNPAPCNSQVLEIVVPAFSACLLPD